MDLDLSYNSEAKMFNRTGKSIKKALITLGIITLLAVTLFAINQFRLGEPASIGIIGGADGPTAIFLTSTVELTLLTYIGLPLLLILNVWMGWRLYKKRRKKEK